MSTVSAVKCWFHVGMPKTGTTSIQETLYYEPRDSGFVYCGFGEINGSYAMSAIAGHTPYFAKLRSMPFGVGDGGRSRALRLLGRCVKRAQARGADLIISAEWCYAWGRSEHLQFLRLAQELGLDPHVVVYLRPPLDWMASGLAQHLRYGEFSTHKALATAYSGDTLKASLQFSERLDLLNELYGRARLTIRPFLRRQLTGGCVVQDFCHVIGMGRPPSVIYRRNESVSLPASQCLHQRNMFLARPLQGALEMLQRDALVLALDRIFPDGSDLRLHPSILGALAPVIIEELATLKRRYGVDLPLTTNDPLHQGLHSLDSLLELDEASRQRLGRAVGGERPVPEMLERLERRLTVSAILRAGQEFLRRRLQHVLTGS